MNLEERDAITGGVIGAAIEVHRVLGPGLLESVYQTCLERELKLREIEFFGQHRIPVEYKWTILEQDFILDIYLPGKLVVELKTVDKFAPIHEAQLLTCLRLTKVHVGLLLNFQVPTLKEGIKRLVL